MGNIVKNDLILRRFSSENEAQCARACRVFKDCGFWSFVVDSYGAGRCYLRTGFLMFENFPHIFPDFVEVKLENLNK